MSNNSFSTLLTNSIYCICKMNYKPKKIQRNNIVPPPNCTSKNYKAIAEINLLTYEYHIQNGTPFDQCKNYLQSWSDYDDLAHQSENKEHNTKVNTAWKNSKNDGRKLWKLIDWDGKAERKTNDLDIKEEQIQRYFRDIFQSLRTQKIILE